MKGVIGVLKSVSGGEMTAAMKEGSSLKSVGVHGDDGGEGPERKSWFLKSCSRSIHPTVHRPPDMNVH